MDNSKHSSIWQIKTFFFIFGWAKARQPTKRFLRQLWPYFGASNKSKPTWPAFTQKRWDTFDKWFKVRQMVVLNYPMPNADSQNFKLDLQLYTSSRQIVTPLFYLQNRWLAKGVVGKRQFIPKYSYLTIFLQVIPLSRCFQKTLVVKKLPKKILALMQKWCILEPIMVGVVGRQIMVTGWGGGGHLEDTFLRENLKVSLLLVCSNFFQSRESWMVFCP